MELPFAQYLLRRPTDSEQQREVLPTGAGEELCERVVVELRRTIRAAQTSSNEGYTLAVWFELVLAG